MEVGSLETLMARVLVGMRKRLTQSRLGQFMMVSMADVEEVARADLMDHRSYCLIEGAEEEGGRERVWKDARVRRMVLSVRNVLQHGHESWVRSMAEIIDRMWLARHAVHMTMSQQGRWEERYGDAERNSS